MITPAAARIESESWWRSPESRRALVVRIVGRQIGPRRRRRDAHASGAHSAADARARCVEPWRNEPESVITFQSVGQFFQILRIFARGEWRVNYHAQPGAGETFSCKSALEREAKRQD